MNMSVSLNVLAGLVAVDSNSPGVPIAVHLLGKAQHEWLTPCLRGLGPRSYVAIEIAGDDARQRVAGLVRTETVVGRFPSHFRKGPQGLDDVERLRLEAGFGPSRVEVDDINLPPEQVFDLAHLGRAVTTG